MTRLLNIMIMKCVIMKLAYTISAQRKYKIKIRTVVDYRNKRQRDKKKNTVNVRVCIYNTDG